MTLHLRKLAVGIESIDHLAAVQAARRGDGTVNRHLTRHGPRRADEILDGGSLYWVIKGFIRVRQRIVGFDRNATKGGKPACGLLLDPRLVQTELRAHGAFQGWRYLKAEDAPADRGDTDESLGDMPEDMARTLRELGLL